MTFNQKVALINGLKIVQNSDLTAPIFEQPYTATSGYATELNQTDKGFMQTYANIPFVYSCVFQIQMAMAGLKIDVFEKKKNDEPILISDNRLFDPFIKPNPFMSRSFFWMYTAGSMELTGKSFWLLVRNKNGYIRWIIPLRPDLMKIKVDANGYITKYVLDVNNAPIEFDPNDIFYMRFYNPLDDYDGMSPLKSGTNSLIIYLKMDTYNKVLLDNQVSGSGVWVAKDPVPDNTFNRVKKEFLQNYAGYQNAGKPIFIDGGYDYKTIQMKPSEIQDIESRKYTRGDILSIYGVPPIIVQEWRDASIIANADVQYKSFYENNIVPKMKMYLEMINTFLIPQFDPDEKHYLKLDEDVISALAEAMATKIEKYKTGFGLAAVSPNDYREKVLGDKRIDDKDMDQYYMPMNLIPITDINV